MFDMKKICETVKVETSVSLSKESPSRGSQLCMALCHLLVSGTIECSEFYSLVTLTNLYRQIHLKGILTPSQSSSLYEQWENKTAKQFDTVRHNIPGP